MLVAVRSYDSVPLSLCVLHARTSLHPPPESAQGMPFPSDARELPLPPPPRPLYHQSRRLVLLFLQAKPMQSDASAATAAGGRSGQWGAGQGRAVLCIWHSASPAQMRLMSTRHRLSSWWGSGALVAAGAPPATASASGSGRMWMCAKVPPAGQGEGSPRSGALQLVLCALAAQPGQELLAGLVGRQQVRLVASLAALHEAPAAPTHCAHAWAAQRSVLPRLMRPW